MSEKQIVNILLDRLSQEPADYWTLLQVSGAHYALFLETLKYLLATSQITYKNGNYALSSPSSNKPLLSSESYAKLQEIAASRPIRDDDLDQALAPLEVIQERLAIFERNGDLRGLTFAVLGDDDCVGVALALTHLPLKVIVLEFDERLCDYYRSFNLPHLEVYQHDLCQPIPEALRKSCDLFFTDPCPALPMFKLFLARGLEVLKGAGCVGYTAMSQVEASLAKWQKIQTLLLEAGCVITELVRGVTTYDLEGEWLLKTGWNVVEEAPHPPAKPTLHWYTSGLMRIETVREPTPLIDGPITWQQRLYKDSEVIHTAQERLIFQLAD